MWYKGSVEVVWDNSFKDYEYTRQPLTNNELINWRAQGYTNQQFTGAMYDSKNTMPEWVYRASKEIGLTKCGYVFYKMQTCDIMPVHSDLYQRYCQFFEVEYNDVYRAIVFLEDWKSGHCFEIDNTAICGYKKGDYVLWRGDTPHAAANIGILDRYTLQVTGVLND